MKRFQVLLELTFEVPAEDEAAAQKFIVQNVIVSPTLHNVDPTPEVACDVLEVAADEGPNPDQAYEAYAGK